MTKLFTRPVAAIALFAALGTAAAAQPAAVAGKDAPAKKADSKKDEPKKDEPKKDEPKKDEPKKAEPSVVKAFEFKTANPAEVQQLVTKYASAQAGSKGGAGRPAVLIAVDPKTKTLFVRGAAADVETAGKIIAQLDNGATDGPLHVIHLQTVAAEEVMRVLGQLDLAAAVHPCPGSRSLVIAHGATNVDQIKTVIEKLDGPSKPAPKGGKVEPKAKN
ncbi:secretin N-terminal domain-containing protein [Frigoriglobus tundricola]|uniref:Aminopeptidase n=1 Tax=Frigoriglobus tundricola TaxID=2774151 RepID=A0A6M5YJZ2_9BACT|nr:secretin N-terminal domain-containing protein [Frigoriglobus tundricola]QJW93583.1 Aminopeptidase [Frigoriglobus tundricola]